MYSVTKNNMVRKGDRLGSLQSTQSENLITEKLKTIRGEEVEISYSRKDQKVTSAYLLDSKGYKKTIEREDMPSELRRINHSSFFQAFLKETYATTSAYSDGNIHLGIHHRLKGGMFQDNEEERKIPADLVRETIELMNKGFRKIDNSDQKAVIIMGRTGVGKTTLVNLLAGRELIGILNNYGNYVIEASNPLPDFKIGHQTTSETSIPHKWKGPDEVVYWDCPGFIDNRGEAQEIANATYIQKLFEIPQVKILVMIQDNDFKDPRATYLISLIRQLDYLFAGRIGPLQKAIALVVSGVPHYRRTEHITATIEDIITEAKSLQLNRAQISLLEFLKTNSISMIEVPTQAGAIDSAPLKNAILKNIGDMQYAENVRVNLSLSDKAQAVALACYNELNNYLNKSIDQFTEAIGKTIENFVMRNKDKAGVEKLNNVAAKLNEVTEKHKYSAKTIPSMVKKCLEIANMCDNTDIQTQQIDSMVKQVECVRFLEQFIAKSSKISLQVAHNIRNLAIQSKATVEKSLIEISAKNAEEKLKLEKERADAAEERTKQEEKRLAEVIDILENQKKEAVCDAQYRGDSLNGLVEFVKGVGTVVVAVSKLPPPCSIM